MQKDIVDIGGVNAEVWVEPADGLWRATASWRGIRYEAVAAQYVEALDALTTALASASGVEKDKLQKIMRDIGGAARIDR